MNASFLADSVLTVVDEWVRKPSKVDDDILKNSIEAGGIQQPLVAIRDGDSLVVVDGIRRLAIAKVIGLPRVPVIIKDLPPGETVDSYGRRLRFILDELRQDLMPSQKAHMIEALKKQFGMGNSAVAQYLGVDADSITNWLAVRNYIQSVVEAMDSGRLSQRSARVFDGMTEKGQKYIWRHHERELVEDGSEGKHKAFRRKYHPDEHPDFYRNPDEIARRLSRTKKSGTKRSAPRPSFTDNEKKKLLTSFEMKDAELADAKAELKELRAVISAATPIAAAIRRNKKLWAMVPDEMRAELERFTEVYS